MKAILYAISVFCASGLNLPALETSPAATENDAAVILRGIVQKTSGTTARDIDGKPAYFASQNGCALDGSDDSAAVQTILDRATNGPMLLVMDGMATCKNLVVRSNTKIVGTSEAKTGFRLLPNCNDWLMSDVLVTDGPPVNFNIDIENLTLDGNLQPMQIYLTNTSSHWHPTLTNTSWVYTPRASNLYVWFDGYVGLTIKDVTFLNAPCSALILGGVATNTVLKNIQIVRAANTGFGHEHDGIHLYGDNSYGYCKNLRIVNGDDNCIALNTDENNWVDVGATGPVPCMSAEGGNISHWTFDGVKLEGEMECGLRLIAYAPAYSTISDVKILNYEDSGLNLGPVMEAGQGGSYLVLSNALFENFSSKNAGNANNELWDFSWAYCKNVKVNGYRTTGTATSTCNDEIKSYFSFTAASDDVTLEGLSIDASQTNAVIVRNHGAMTNLTMGSSEITGKPMALVFQDGPVAMSSITFNDVHYPAATQAYTNKTSLPPPAIRVSDVPRR